MDTGIAYSGAEPAHARDHSDRNRSVTPFMPELRKATREMNPLKAALLSLAMVSAIAFCGVGIYTADAANAHLVVDGYGVVPQAR